MTEPFQIRGVRDYSINMKISLLHITESFTSSDADIRLEQIKIYFYLLQSLAWDFSGSLLFYILWKVFQIIVSLYLCLRARGSVVVKAPCYKLEGRGFDTRWGNV
jgi:hypothetical protein